MNAVVIPAKNEQDSIKETLSQIPKGYDVFVIVGKGTTDDTATIAADCGAIAFSSNGETYGEALLTGFEAAKDYDNVIVMDCESHRFAEIEPYIGKADVVAGRRNKSHRGFIRNTISWLASTFISSSITDVSNGFRCYSHKAVEMILEQKVILSIVPSYCFNAEVAKRLQWLKTIEFPMVYTDGKSGLTWKEIWKSIIWFL